MNLAPQCKVNLPRFIGKVNFKVDEGVVLNLFTTIDQQLPIYLTEKDYQTIDTLITPERVKTTLESDIRQLSSPTGIVFKEIISNDPAGLIVHRVKKTAAIAVRQKLRTV